MYMMAETEAEEEKGFRFWKSLAKTSKLYLNAFTPIYSTTKKTAFEELGNQMHVRELKLLLKSKFSLPRIDMIPLLL